MIDRSDLQRIPACGLDLASCLDSGQVLHWERCGNGYAGAIGDAAVYLEQDGDSLLVPRGEEERVGRYLGLDHPMEAIRSSFPRGDDALARAVAYCPGLRILSQPRWECLATFITSSQKRVAHIRAMSLQLRRRFGKRCRIGGMEVFAYPAPKAFAAAGEAALRECGLGYRAGYLHTTATRLADRPGYLEEIGELGDEVLREKLMEFHGVGRKVADCVLLFAYARYRAFPVDVWVERVLRGNYFANEKNPSRRELLEFSENHFGNFGGYAQQYLFHHARLTYIKEGKGPLEG